MGTLCATSTDVDLGKLSASLKRANKGAGLAKLEEADCYISAKAQCSLAEADAAKLKSLIDSCRDVLVSDEARALASEYRMVASPVVRPLLAAACIASAMACGAEPRLWGRTDDGARQRTSRTILDPAHGPRAVGAGGNVFPKGAARLVYADWLEQSGSLDRAEFLRGNADGSSSEVDPLWRGLVTVPAHQDFVASVERAVFTRRLPATGPSISRATGAGNLAPEHQTSNHLVTRPSISFDSSRRHRHARYEDADRGDRGTNSPGYTFTPDGMPALEPGDGIALGIADDLRPR